MSFLPAYLDSSALLKFVFPERESARLRDVLKSWPDWVTSQLSLIECHRAVGRAGGQASEHATLDRLLATCVVIRFDESIVRQAGTIGSPDLRSLDAIHLAAALSLGDYPEAFITYDNRLASAARALDLNVLQPGL
jgi:predicted nucleic acid-binding protein